MVLLEPDYLRLWVFRSGVTENSVLLGHDAGAMGNWILVFWGNVESSYSWVKTVLHLPAVGREVNREAGKWGSSMHTLPSIFCQLKKNWDRILCCRRISFLSKTKWNSNKVKTYSLFQEFLGFNVTGEVSDFAMNYQMAFPVVCLSWHVWVPLINCEQSPCTFITYTILTFNFQACYYLIIHGMSVVWRLLYWKGWIFEFSYQQVMWKNCGTTVFYFLIWN